MIQNMHRHFYPSSSKDFVPFTFLLWKLDMTYYFDKPDAFFWWSIFLFTTVIITELFFLMHESWWMLCVALELLSMDHYYLLWFFLRFIGTEYSRDSWLFWKMGRKIFNMIFCWSHADTYAIDLIVSSLW